MYGPQSNPRRSFDDIMGEVEAEFSAPARPKPRPKTPRPSFDQIAGEVAAVPYGPEVTPSASSKPQPYGPDIPAQSLPKMPKAAPKPAADPRTTEIVDAIREIDRRKNQAIELHRSADTVTEENARNAMRAQADAALENANRLGEEVAKKYKGRVEVGFGRDADPNQKRRWVYAKPIDEKVGAEYQRGVQADERAKKVASYRKDYEGSNPISQYLQRLSTQYLGDRADTTPDEQAELDARREAMGLGTRTQEKPGLVTDLTSRAARALINAIPSEISGGAEISDTLYRGAQRLTGNRLPQSTDWAPVVAPVAREIRTATDPLFPTDPNRDEDFKSKVASGFGSAAGFGVTSKIAGMARVPSQIAVGTAGVGLGADEIVQEARAAGFDPNKDPGRWDRMVALAGATGLTEIFGFGKTLDRWGMKRQFIKRAMEVLEEGGQEALQQYMGNVNAAYVGQYDEERPLGKDVLENAVIGGIIGGSAQAADAASAKIGRIRDTRATAREPIQPLNLKPSVPLGTQTQVVGVPTSGTFRTQPKAVQAEAAPIVDLQTEAARQAAGITGQPVAVPATPQAAIPATPQPAALLFPEVSAAQQPQQDLSTLSPQDRTAALLDQLRQQKEGRARATLEQSLNREFAEAGAMVGSAAQNWDIDRPTAEQLAVTGANRLKSALQGLQKSAPYIAELAAVSQGAGQPGPYIAAAQQIQQQLEQADGLFRLDAERERQAKELQVEAEKAQKKAEKETAKHARFADREQAKLDREMKIEQKRAEIQQRRDDAAAKRMQTAETAKTARRKQLEEQRQQARDEKTKQRADQELQKLARHDSALRAADDAGRRHQEYLSQGMIAEAINELTVQQNQLRDAVRLLPATPESQNIKADLNRFSGQIGNRIGDLRKQASGKSVPVTQAIPPLLQPDAVVNEAGGVPKLQSFYEPGAVFDRLNPTLGDVEEDLTPFLTAVRRAGGIANDEITPGELRRLGIKESGTTGLVNDKGGLAPDRMREAMVEAGYLPEDSTVDDLFQAIEGELRAGKKARPSGSIAEFYDQWESEQGDTETGGQGDGETDGKKTAYYAEEKTQSRQRQPIEEFADDIEEDDLAALKRSIQRSESANPRPYAERTRPGEPGSGLVSFSQYAELEARNREQEQALYDNEPTSETFQDAIEWITEDAAKAGIGQSHVDAMVAYALNWHGEKAFWESRGLSMDTVQQAIDSLDADIAATHRKIAALPAIVRTEAEREVAALDVLFDDAEAVNLLERIVRGEDNAADEFRDYAANEHGISGETISDLIEARRPARNVARPRTASQSAQGQSTARDTRPREEKSLEPLYDLLNQNPFAIPDVKFDNYLRDLEGWRNEGIHGSDFGGVDLSPSLERDMRRVMAGANKERRNRVKQKRLPAKHTPLPIPTAEQRAERQRLIAETRDLPPEEQARRMKELRDRQRASGESASAVGKEELGQAMRGQQAREVEPKTVSHSDPSIDGQPILAETQDGRVVVPNPGNKSGVSVVKNQAETRLEKSEPQSARGRLAYAVADHLIAGNKFANIVEARKFIAQQTGQAAKAGTVETKQVDEAIEAGAVIAARRIVEEGKSPRETYQALLNLQDRLPSLNARTSTSMLQQAYSTPLPLGYVADRLAGIDQTTTVYEPSAGHSALLLTAKPENVIANELNAERAAAVRDILPGAEVTENDAADWKPSRKVDRVITNPPFGAVKDDNGKSRRFQIDGKYETSEIDHAIAFEALKAMKDDGKAVLIVGGLRSDIESARSSAYNTGAKRNFYFTLYNQYNVTDHFTVSGDLYAKQGAGWPVDVIVIDGRGKSKRDLPAVAVPQIIRTWDELGAKLDAASANRNQNAESAADNVRLGERGLPGSERDSGASQFAAADERVSGVSARSGQDNDRSGTASPNGPGLFGGSPASGGPAGSATESPRGNRRRSERGDLQQRTPTQQTEQSGSLPWQDDTQQGQSASQTTGQRSQPGAVDQRTDRGTGRTPDVGSLFDEELDKLFGTSEVPQSSKLNKTPENVRETKNAQPYTKKDFDIDVKALNDEVREYKRVTSALTPELRKQFDQTIGRYVDTYKVKDVHAQLNRLMDNEPALAGLAEYLKEKRPDLTETVGKAYGALTAEVPMDDFSPAQAVLLVADSVDDLRKQDVYRLLDETAEDNRRPLANYVIRHRPDLAAETRTVMVELGDEGYEQPDKTQPKQPLPSTRGQELGRPPEHLTKLFAIKTSGKKKSTQYGSSAAGGRKMFSWGLGGEAYKTIQDALQAVTQSNNGQFPDDTHAFPDEWVKRETGQLRPGVKINHEAFRPSQSFIEQEPRTTKEAAKSAVKESGDTLKEIAKGLSELFGGPKVSMGLSFDEKTYAAAKPHFETAIQHFQQATRDVREVMANLLKELNQRFGFTPDVLQKMKPYIVRFVEEQTAPKQIDEATPTGVQQSQQQAGLFTEGLTNESTESEPESVRQSEGGSLASEQAESVRDRNQESGQPGRRTGKGRIRETDGSGRRSVDGERADSERSDESVETPAFVDQADSTRTETQPPSAAHRPGNYEITDIEDIVPSGKKSKLEANLAAIRLLRDLQAQGRRPTTDEQAVLGKFVGWGQFPDLFNDINEAGKKLEAEREELKTLLSPEEYERAKRSTLNAHYTSPRVVQKMWEMMERLGFKGGRVLEPSMGVGYFYGLMPRNLMASSKLAGVELDPTTGTIARMLYPDASINVRGFQDVKIADGFYDLVIGNVPFGDFRVHDPDYNKYRANIHDYFVLKALDKTRTGGVVAVITSTGTMDKADARIRKEIAKRADLVAAMRFPDSAFEKNAGTQVVTDLLIFQKRAEGEKANTGWTELGELPDPDGGEPIPISKYYMQNPEMILGTLDRKSKLYGSGHSHVSTTPDFAQRFEAAIRSLPEGLFAEKTATATEPTEVASAVQDKTVEGGYVLRDGRVLQRQGDSYIVPPFEPSDHRKVAALLKVRDALNALNAAQLTTGETAAPRQALVRAYDNFVSVYGPIRKTTNAKLLAEDPSSYLLLALEKSYDPKKGKAVKADIFTKDTIARTRTTSDVSSPSSAVAVSLFESGKVDIDRIAELLKVSPEEARKRLLKDGLAFENPRGGWESSEGYLSGNVRKKLVEAREAAAVDEKYQINVDALEKVQPADVPIEMISVKLGASWLPAEDVKNFAAHLMQSDVNKLNIQYMPTAGTWLVSGRAGPSKLATEVYGTSRADFIDVLDAALNDKPIKIYDKTRDGSVFNLEESEKASAKVQEVRDQFADWLWTDHERTNRLHRYYNDNFNNMRVIQYTGEHYRNAEGKFVLPGMNPAIALRPNQVKDVWQAVANGKLLDASEVGAGKTFILGSIAMEWKRLGIARKPAIAVPKPRIAATVAELQLQYPAARILSLEKSFDKESRKRTTAQMATGDYDMVVLSHEQLDKMPMSAEVIQEFIGAELDEIAERIKDAEAAAEEAGDKQMGNRIVKRLEKIKERVEARLQEALDGSNKDDVVQFEETGIDALLVDEAHGFKSLPVYSRRSDVKGVPTTRSDRATNMLMRTRWLMRQNNNKGVVFATGTPVTNTLAEVYNLQKYLQPEVLEERGLENFDAWADQFANISTQFEYTASGDYKAVSRMAEFVNLPELQQSIRQIMATNFVDDMTWIARPKKIEQVITSPMTEDQQDYLQEIRKRVEVLKKMTPRERKESGENFLLISTDARKSALSPAMVRPGADSGGKIERLAENVLKIHKARPEVAQMIFLDFGVNPNAWGYSVYDDIQNRLVLGGIPKERIANFARLSDVARQKAAEKLNSGEYLIGIGSSGKMGTGINAQQRLAAMHHMDAPWLPAYLEQRNGRGHRQGNLNDPTKPADEQVVDAFYYTTEGSFDVVMWQALTRKSEFIRQFMRGDTSVREMRMDDTGDDDTGEMGPEMILAATSGNPFELDRIRLIKDIEKLERQERSHRQQISRFKTQIASAAREQEETKKRIAQTEKDAEQFEATKGQKFTATINGKAYEDRKVAGNQLAFAVIEAAPRDVTKLGTYRGFNLYIDKTAGNPIAYLEREGGREYRFVLNLSEPEPAFTSADANLRSSVQQVSVAQQHLDQLVRDEQTAKAEIDKPFKRATELKDKREALARIEQKMADWLKRKDLPAVERRPGRPQVTGLKGGEMTGRPRIAERRSSAPFTDRYTVRDLAANATAEYRPARNRPGTVYLNDWGHALVRDTLVTVYGEGVSQIPGDFTLDTAAIRNIADEMRDRAGGAFAGIAKQLDTAADDADANGRDVAIVTKRAGQTIGQVKQAVRHETTHTAQSAIDPTLTGAATREWLIRQPKAQQIMAELRRRGYDPSTFGYEAVAYVASGEFGTFGLTLDEATNLLDSYYRATVEKFGASALEKFGAIDPKLQPTLEGVRRETQTGRTNSERAAQNTGRGNRSANRPTGEYQAGASDSASGRERGATGVPRVAERKDRRFSFGELKNEPSGTVLGSGFGGLQSLRKQPQPKTTPLREIIAEHKPLQVDPYKIQDAAIEEILNAAGRGVAGTLPGARALHWAGKLKLKPVANKLADRQAQFIEGVITNTNEIIASFEAMQAAERGSEAYSKAKSEMYKARRELHAKLQRTGEYSGPFEYLAKYAKGAVLTAPHILTSNILDHLASFPFHEAQKLMGFLLPVRVLRRWGVDVERTHVDFRDLVPAIGREIGAILKGSKDAMPDFIHSLRYGTTDLLLDEEIARQQVKRGDEEPLTGGADRYEFGKRAKGVPGLDQILTAIGRTHGAVDVAGRRWAFATAITSQADAIAKRIGKENEFTKEEIAALREDLAAEPSPQMIVLAMDEANRFVLDYPTFLYKMVQTARKVGEKEYPVANKAFNNALDFLVKFQKIPMAAQAQSLWHYSPLGLVGQANRVRRAAKAKKAGEPINAQQSAEIVERLQQGALGTLVWAGVGLLGSLGYLQFTGGDDRERVRNAQEALGYGYDPELMIGDTAITLNKLGTFGRAGSVAARLAKAVEPRRDAKTGEPEPEETRAKRISKAAMKGIVLDNPVGRGLGEFFTSDTGDPVQNIARGQIRSLQPGILRTVAKVQDGTKRIPDDTSFTSKVAADFKTGNPLYRQSLQPRLDAIGSPVEEDNPFSPVRTLKRNPQIEEMIRLGTGPSKPQRKGSESATDYNQRVKEQGSKMVETMRRIAEDPKQAGRSDAAKARIYATSLTTDKKAPLNIPRMEKLSEESSQIEYEIEALRVDAYEALRQLPSYQRLSESGKKSALKQVDDQLKSFRARAESTRRNKKTGRVSTVREKAARLPDLNPQDLAKTAVLSAQ